ncbi:MAG: hypothetical protein JO250_02905 [Armatimonadetes bacterium]|nr:hypothetical protein [Armatimonadota bacterium]
MQRFRPMALGDIFDEAFDLYKKNFPLLLLVTAIVVVPLHVLAPLFALRFPQEPSLAGWIAANFGGLAPGQALPQWGPFFSGPVLFVPLYPLAAAVEFVALAGATSACYLGEPQRLWAFYRVPLRRLAPLILTLLLYAVLMALGLLLCYVGTLIPLTLLVFTAHAFALEDKNFGRATGRSNRLVSGHGGRVFGSLILLELVAAIVALGIQLPLVYAFDVMLNVTPGSDILFGGGSAVTALSEQRRIVADISQGLSNLVLTPFVFCVLTVLYYDLRVRKEAFDIELLARGLRYPPLSALGGYLPPASPPVALPPSGAGSVPR